MYASLRADRMPFFVPQHLDEPAHGLTPLKETPTRAEGNGTYSFSYSVTVSNSKENPVAVVGHDWTFTDALGVQRHERGEGLGGEHGVGKVRLDAHRALNYQGR